MTKEEEMLESTINMGFEQEEHFTEAAKAVTHNILEEAMLPKDALGIGDQTMDKLYNEAYQRYNIGKYEDAEKIFSQLLILNAMESKYLFGLAACAHMRKDYQLAAEQYVRCSLYDPEDPISYFHASDCYIELDDTLSAKIALQMVLERSGDKPEFKMMKDRALLSMESLNKGKETDKNEQPPEL